MALIFRSGHLKHLPCGITGLCKTISKQNNNVLAIQVASITGKSLREDRPPRPAPFDWRNKRYSWWHAFTDAMIERMDDNSKIVAIEGLPGVQKDKFAKELAEELEMLYLPNICFDDIRIDPYGFDYRSLNPKLPFDAQYVDDKMWHENPTSRNSASIQMEFYQMRFGQYIDALAHVLSTGQGVVIQRCPWSDIVFAKAMHDNGHISKGGYSYYKSAIANSAHRILKPHLVIYLDVPGEVSLEKVKKRGHSHEISSKALTPKFLKDVEKNYKEIYLPDISRHAHLLVYDWTEDHDLDFIVHDIESLSFDDYGREDEKMSDWRFASIDWMRGYRSIFHNMKDELMQSIRIPRLDVPEMLISGQDMAIHREVIEQLYETHPHTKYDPGFNPEVDKGILFKTQPRGDDYKRRVPQAKS